MSIGALVGVVAEDGGQRVHEHRLAVRARAVQKKQRVLSRRAGECVTDHSLQVALQLLVTTRDLVEELTPGRTLAPGRGRGDFRHPVSTVMWTLPAGLEIDHAARGVEQPRVGIPLLGGGGMPAIRPCQPFHAADRARAGELGGHLGILGTHGGMPANAADQIGGGQRVLGAPAIAVPHQPAAPGRHVAPVAVVASGKGQRQRILRAPDRLVAAGHRIGIHGDVVHLQARAMSEKCRNVKALGDGVGRIPPLGCLLWRVQDVAGFRARRQDGLRCLRRIVPARLVAVRPDQHGLAGQRRPVGFLHRGIRTVHRRRGSDASIDECLRAFLALDQHDLTGIEARPGWL